MLNRLAIITTHPIQYYAPIFKLLTERGKIRIKVFYTWGEEALLDKYDPGFDKIVTWDIPLLDGYEYEFLENTSLDKGSHHYGGIDNPQIINKILEWKTDQLLVIGWNFKSHLRALRYFKNNMPVFFRGDSTLLDEKRGPSIKKVMRKTFLTWLYRHIDIAFFVGENNRRYYKKFGLKEEQLMYAPHAIDNARFSENEINDTKAANRWREELGIKREDFVFLFAGKLESKKNPQLLVEAYISEFALTAHLIIVGNGYEEVKLKEIAQSYPNIHFIDFQNQKMMPVIYRMADVFILPSKGPGETWGLALNEAMACKKSVIASDRCGGAIDLIKNGENGYIFKTKDIDSLKETMKKVYDHRAEQAKYGLNSFNRIKNFNFTVISKAIEDAILNNKIAGIQ